MRPGVSWAVVSSIVVFAASGDAQEPKARALGPTVDEAKVEMAIRKGVAHLRGKMGSLAPTEGNRPHELVLWTLIHAGVREGDSDFNALFKRVTESELERTYNVSLQAMILEELDRVKHRERIWQCAQFLVDNQCKHGEWGYGDPTVLKDASAGGAAGTPAKKSASSAKGSKPAPLRKIPVTKQRDGLKPWGDNSNSQYAALGLRACHDAGIVIPAEVIERAVGRWKGMQRQKGWNYRGQDDAPYGSMTAGAVGSLAIYFYMQNKPWMGDKALAEGVEWLGENFSVTENPKRQVNANGPAHTFYYLYALERAGVLYGTEKLGAHEWYREGAKAILEAQQADGSWKAKDNGNDVRDTCFAILFLRRATRPLVETVDRLYRKP